MVRREKRWLTGIPLHYPGVTQWRIVASSNYEKRGSKKESVFLGCRSGERRGARGNTQKQGLQQQG